MPKDAGSGVAVGRAAAPLRESTVSPKLLRIMERSVRSMVSAPSKLPSDLSKLALPKLLRTVERSERSTVPSPLVSPGRWTSRPRIPLGSSKVIQSK